MYLNDCLITKKAILPMEIKLVAFSSCFLMSIFDCICSTINSLKLLGFYESNIDFFSNIRLFLYKFYTAYLGYIENCLLYFLIKHLDL